MFEILILKLCLNIVWTDGNLHAWPSRWEGGQPDVCTGIYIDRNNQGYDTQVFNFSYLEKKHWFHVVAHCAGRILNSNSSANSKQNSEKM
jgi:hypothetical protein